MAININEYDLIEKGLYRHNKDATKWVARYTTEDGKRKRKVFTVAKDTKSNMKLYAMNKLSELMGVKAVSKVTVESIFNKWAANKEITSWAANTSCSHRTAFKNHIKPYIGSMALAEVKPADISKLLLERDISVRTQKAIMEILKPLYDYAIDNELITQTPLKSIHRIKRNSLKEKRAVVGAVEKYKTVYSEILKLDDRDKALMLFGFHGRRKTETLQLEWSDIFEDTYIIRAENNKVSEDMVYTLQDDLKDVLRRLKEEKVSKYLFDSPKIPGQPMSDIRDIVYKVRKSTKIDEFGFHWMRNLAVTALSQQGVATVDLSAMLGHTDLNTLQKYLSIERKSSTERTAAASKRLLNEK